MSKAHEANRKRSQWPKLEPLEQQNKVVLDYDLKYKINTHEFIVI